MLTKKESSQRPDTLHACVRASACAQRLLHACTSTQGQKSLFNSHLTPLADGFDCGVILGMKVQVSVK